MALTKFNFNSFDVTTAASSGLAFNSSANGFDTAAAGAMTLITTNTISSGVSSSSFTSNIDSTYDTYLFKLINIHPATIRDEFQLNFRDGSSAFDASKTTTLFSTYIGETHGDNTLAYDPEGVDLTNSTLDGSGGNYCATQYSAGYCNVTDAIDGVDFKFAGGNIDSGIIKMYGITK